MSGFNRFYLWGVKMKYHMSIYTVAGVFFKAIVNALQGVYTVDILTMLEMLVVSMVFASAETAIFTEEKPFGDSKGRVLLWGLLANVAFLGGALGFGWFRDVPVWGGVLLLFLLTRYVSLGSVFAGVSFPFLSWYCYPDPVVVILAFCAGGLVVWKHRENIQRLVQGKERRFHFRRDKNTQ